MRILTYIFKLVVTILPFLFSGSSTAQAAVPLEVRTPYFNFWTPILSVGDAEYFFTQAVRHFSPISSGPLRFDMHECVLFSCLPTYYLLVSQSHGFNSD
jgi:hypothetical protein